MRLVSPIPGLDFMGRLEVRYNSTWGTVCDDYFAYNEARLVCRMADYSDALCYVREAGMGQGTGQWFRNSFALFLSGYNFCDTRIIIHGLDLPHVHKHTLLQSRVSYT